MKGKAAMANDDKGEASTSRSMKKEEQEESQKKKMVILKSKDGLEFKVELAVAKQSGIISVIAEESQQEEEEEEVDGEKVLRIPCNEVRGEVLDLVIKFWKEHHDHNDGAIIDEKKNATDKAYDQEHLRNWDKEFAGNIGKELFFELLIASNFLDSAKLLNFTSQTVAQRIQDMTVEQVREYFEIVGDFTSEEEEKLRKENEWAFDD